MYRPYSRAGLCTNQRFTLDTSPYLCYAEKMARRWEEFADPGTPSIAELHVSMSPKGNIHLSRRSFEALGCPSHVVMLWDSDKDTAGILPVPPRTVNAFRVYPTHRSGAHRFHAQRFLKKYDIRLDYGVRSPHGIKPKKKAA